MHLNATVITSTGHSHLLGFSFKSDPASLIINFSVAYWSWQIEPLCLSVNNTNQLEPHTPGDVLGFQGHNHGSYLRSNKKTKA